jgi:hypothetical protein
VPSIISSSPMTSLSSSPTLSNAIFKKPITSQVRQSTIRQLTTRQLTSDKRSSNVRYLSSKRNKKNKKN